MSNSFVINSKKIGFVDIGAGLELKSEWKLIPTSFVRKIDFEVNDNNNKGALAISNSNLRLRFIRLLMKEILRFIRLIEPFAKPIENRKIKNILTENENLNKFGLRKNKTIKRTKCNDN